MRQARGGSDSSKRSSWCAPDSAEALTLATSCVQAPTPVPLPSSGLRKKVLGQGTFHAFHWGRGLKDTWLPNPGSPLRKLVLLYTPAGSQGAKPEEQREMEWIPGRLPRANPLQLAAHTVLGESSWSHFLHCPIWKGPFLGTSEATLFLNSRV